MADDNNSLKIEFRGFKAHAVGRFTVSLVVAAISLGLSMAIVWGIDQFEGAPQMETTSK
ncbi:hypothetical protein [Agrobacterium genomosp. 13]|uniref:Uncharacterized protein n=1 Tax=Agrobacterium genomosp. 13 str. CFBP 6927 TaxID=1183428 RepID=A0ABM9VE34_9HYPH|nr:hypothetical protein [Agrobacterium genomosp. 13]CUX24256.1 hypothetical protein AGR13a_Cc240037 [Agrobacterium genomosp. 13 str. CFBP 6927]